MVKNLASIFAAVLALVIVGLVYLRSLTYDDFYGASINSLSDVSANTQTAIGIILLFVLVVSIFFVINTIGIKLKTNFHK